MNTIQLFNQFKPMMLKASWIYKRKYPNVEFSEIKSMAFEIFVKTIDKYDSNKASFSTYLFNNLKRLNKYCKDENIKESSIGITPKLEIEMEEVNFDNFIRTMEIIDSKVSLSNDAKEIVQFIEERVWEIPGYQYIRPTWNSVSRWYKYYGWTNKRIRRAWIEIEKWWKEIA